ncbi:MAG TPA: YlcI/YnfO family protein [Vicinamibacterales bacterium]
MRTTVRLPTGLMAQAKKLARDTDRTLTQLIEDSLREAIARRSQRARRSASFTIVHGNGVQPGVDLDNTSALLDLMDGELGFSRR